MPARFRDQLPEAPIAADVPPAPPSTVQHVFLHVFNSFHTQFNKFWIAHEYCHRPSYDLDTFVSLNELSSRLDPSWSPSLAHPSPVQHEQPPPWPWANMTISRLMTWALTGNAQKSASEVTQLVQDVLQHPDFSIEGLQGFDAHTEACRLDAAQKAFPADDMFGMDKWKCNDMDITVPTREINRAGNGKKFTVQGFYHHPLLDIIRSVFTEALSKWFHLTPFKKVRTTLLALSHFLTTSDQRSGSRCSLVQNNECTMNFTLRTLGMKLRTKS